MVISRWSLIASYFNAYQAGITEPRENRYYE